MNMKKNIFENVFFGCGTALGDMFVTNAIVHHYAERSSQLFIPCNETNFPTAKSLYQDTPNIHIVSGNEYESLKLTLPNPTNIMPWTFWNTEITLTDAKWVNWERQLYEYFDLPYSLRYKNFKLPSNIPNSKSLFKQLTGESNRYIVIHRTMFSLREHSVNFTINHFNPENLPIIEITKAQTPNVLDYYDLLINAEQVHVVPSSIYCFIDSISSHMKGKLYLHNVRDSFLSQLNCNWNASWNVVHYPEKII